MAVYSKNVFNYVSFRTKFPTLTKDGQMIWLGLENDAIAGTGIASFCFHRSDGVEHFSIVVGGAFNWRFLAIDGALPADAKTVKHRYSVAILKPWAEFYVDNDPVAFAINSPNLNFPDVSHPPYGITRTTAPFSHMALVLIENMGFGEELVLPLAPYGTRTGYMAELPPRVFRLYETGTKNLFAGKIIESGTLISHPVPIFGYGRKTILFRADRDSTTGGLVIEVLTQTGNWRTYDAVTYIANTDWFYSIAGEAVLARLKYTPASYPATVAEGEVILA